MRIVTDRPDLLVIDHRPVGAVLGVLAFLAAMLALGGTAIATGGLAPGLALIVLGGGSALAALSSVAERCTVTLDRRAGEVTLTQRNYRGQKVRRYPLDRLKRAGTQTKLDWNWKPRLHRLVLYLRDGPGLAVTETHQSGPAPSDAAQTINRWLTQT